MVQEKSAAQKFQIQIPANCGHFSSTGLVQVPLYPFWHELISGAWEDGDHKGCTLNERPKHVDGSGVGRDGGNRGRCLRSSERRGFGQNRKDVGSFFVTRTVGAFFENVLCGFIFSLLLEVKKYKN